MTAKLGTANRAPSPASRAVVDGTQGVISSGHHLTSMAGMRMLVAGGNAFDAVAAAGFAAAVVEPVAAYSLGAEGVFMVYDAASGEVLSLSGQGVAPGRATSDFYTAQGLDAIPTGPGDKAHLSFTVPGVVHALISLLETYGTKKLGEVMAPSVHYAEHGIPFYEQMVQSLSGPSTREQFNVYPPGGMDVFYRNGEVPRTGSLLVQKGLANTLKRMAAAESSGSGSRLAGLRAARREFYEGETARTTVESAQRAGGVLSMEDLAGYRASFAEPVRASFMGHDIYGHATWTQGPVLMQTLNMLDGFDLKKLGHNSPEYVHTVAEALKLAMADRQAFYGDPDFATVPIDGLLSKEYALERARLIDPAKAHPELPPAGDPWRYSSNNAPSQISEAVLGQPQAEGETGGEGTTHAAVVDRDGNMACATLSGGAFGKSVFFPELGYALSTRIEMFVLQAGHPNVVAPGKRPRTTLVNYIVSKDGRPVMTIGCPGGDHQAQANTQLVLNTLLFGMNPQEAIEAPRFGTESVVNSFYPHVYYPGRLSLEHAITEESAESLRHRGHEVVRARSCGTGATVAIRDPNTGILSTGADPRRPCHAIGW